MKPGEHRQREEHSGAPPHRSTTSALAAACVAAGTVQVPEAHRCHPNSSPAPTSTGSAESPYAGTCTSPKSHGGAHDRDGGAEPFEPGVREPAEQRLLGHRRQERERRAAALHGSGTGEPETFAATTTASSPHRSARPWRQWALAFERDRDRGQPDRQYEAANNALRVPVGTSAKGRATSTATPTTTTSVAAHGPPEPRRGCWRRRCERSGLHLERDDRHDARGSNGA